MMKYYKLFVWTKEKPEFKHMSSFSEKYSEILKNYLSMRQILIEMGCEDLYQFQVRRG